MQTELDRLRAVIRVIAKNIKGDPNNLTREQLVFKLQMTQQALAAATSAQPAPISAASADWSDRFGRRT